MYIREMSHKRCLWFSFVFFHLGSFVVLGSPESRMSGDEESKGKGEAKQRHSRGSERDETLTPHPVVKTLGDFLFTWKNIILFIICFLQTTSTYTWWVIYDWRVPCPRIMLYFQHQHVWSSHAFPMEPWSHIDPPKKAVYFRESGQIVITKGSWIAQVVSEISIKCWMLKLIHRWFSQNTFLGN